jgi:hypothetical protein
MMVSRRVMGLQICSDRVISRRVMVSRIDVESSNRCTGVGSRRVLMSRRVVVSRSDVKVGCRGVDVEVSSSRCTGMVSRRLMVSGSVSLASRRVLLTVWVSMEIRASGFEEIWMLGYVSRRVLIVEKGSCGWARGWGNHVVVVVVETGVVVVVVAAIVEEGAWGNDS